MILWTLLKWKNVPRRDCSILKTGGILKPEDVDNVYEFVQEDSWKTIIVIADIVVMWARVGKPNATIKYMSSHCHVCPASDDL